METDVIPAMERLIKWLPLHFPDSQEVTVVHGDFRYCLADSISVEHLRVVEGEQKCSRIFPLLVLSQENWGQKLAAQTPV